MKIISPLQSASSKFARITDLLLLIQKKTYSEEIEAESRQKKYIFIEHRFSSVFYVPPHIPHPCQFGIIILRYWIFLKAYLTK